MLNSLKKHNKVTKAVIAVAGYGTRFLPATKNQPKEMLPIIDKPIIQYLVEEAVASGITDVILVTRFGQSVMEDYFDNNLELEKALEDAGKEDRLKAVQDVTKLANIIYVRQKKHLPYGNGTPLKVVENLIDDDEAFVYMFGDDLTLAQTPVTKQLIDVYEKEKPKAVLGVQEVPEDEIHKYGSIEYKDIEKNYEIKALVEKAPANEAPSRMAQFGRFVFTYDVIREMMDTPQGIDGELWITDALNSLAQKGEKVIAQPIDGEWLTTGDPMRWLKANIKFALDRDDLKDKVGDFIRELDL